MSERAKTLREKLIAALSNKDGELCDHFGEASPEKMADAALSVIAALAEDDAAGGPEVKLRSVAQSLRATAAEGKNTIIMPDAAETFAAALTLAADIFEQWQARAAIRALGE